MSAQLKFLRKCSDSCQMFLKESVSATHYGCLRCREHGFVKWLSYEQYQELQEVMYPSQGVHIDEVL